MKNKKTIIISVVVVILLLAYITTYISLRRTETFSLQGEWVIYFYKKSFVRQYALNKQSRLKLMKAIKRGDTSFYAGHEGDVGENWFCVYRKPGTKIYRIFALAENIENAIRFNKDKD